MKRAYSKWEWTRAYLALAVFFPIYAALWFLATFVKTLPPGLTAKLLLAHQRYTKKQEMDFRIPPVKSIPAYMHRWWRIPRNWAANIYYHIVLRSDDDRALHDHPWPNFSLVLEGGYWEHTIAEGGINRRVWCGPGTMKFRWHGRKAHRLELERKSFDELTFQEAVKFSLDGVEATMDGDTETVELPAKTIFITGPVLRRWGFHDPKHGWVDAYDWDAHCERIGKAATMPMAGGSDASASPRNRA